MKQKLFRKKQKGIAERKTEVKRNRNFPYKAVALGLLLWLCVSWLFFNSGIVKHISLAEGNRVPTTIVASVDFECEDLTASALKRTEASESILPVFTIDSVPTRRATELVDKIFNRLSLYTTASTNEQQTIENSIGDLLHGSNVDTRQLITLFPSNQIQSARSNLTAQMEKIMSEGILSEEYRRTLFRDAPDRKLTIVDPSSGISRTVSQQAIHSTQSAIQQMVAQAPDATQQKLFEQLLSPYVTDNMTYDESATAALRNKAIAAVNPVMQQYRADTPLVRAGETATTQTLLLLKQHELKRQEEQELFDQALEILGNTILLLAGLIATAVMIRVIAPQLIRQPAKLLLFVILSLITLCIARLLTYLSVQYSLISPALLMYLVPYAVAILLCAILLGGGAAICLGLWISFATAVLFNSSFNVFALGILITITATSTARNIHRRASLFRAGLWVCAVKVLFVLVTAALNQPALPFLIGQLCAAFLSGMLSTVLALLMIPMFEKLFKITTDITLLELSDMGHPLLQKMAIQAPGTYHHSLMVATLAQTAAEAIGANSLLVRVCAYYHDIGKLAKPEFFTENIQHKENPHDELSPHMSALVIVSHVKEGLTLAKRHKLPQPIMDAIEQHHGNGLISFFYHKAKQQNENASSNNMVDLINDSDFRYGGAPAVSQEMAILSLADASEAASRSIEKPTPQKITNMMNDIFAAKIRDGQMDYASLTMAEINAVKQSFIFSLTNMLHGRIPYPKDHENKHNQPTDSASPSS